MARVPPLTLRGRVGCAPRQEGRASCLAKAAPWRAPFQRGEGGLHREGGGHQRGARLCACPCLVRARGVARVFPRGGVHGLGVVCPAVVRSCGVSVASARRRAAVAAWWLRLGATSTHGAGVVRCARAGVRRCGWLRWLRLRIRRARRGGAPIPAWLDGDEARGGCSAAVVRKRTFCCFQCYPLPLLCPRRLVSPRTGCNWAGATTGVEALEVRENDKEQACLPLPLLHETAQRHAHSDIVPLLQASTNALVSLKVV